MTCVEPQRMRMTRSFSHYTDGVRFYLSRKLKIFFDVKSAQNNQTPQHLMLLKP